MESMKLCIYACLCGLMLWGAGCNEESAGLPTGALYVGIEEDATLLTKAESAVTNESLRVDIIAAEGDTIKSYSDYIDEVKGKKIVLPVGTYMISVKSNQSEEAGWEKPFYSGSKEITIQSGEITSVQIVCKITNTKVTVEYADNLADYFSRYETTVSNTSGSLLYTRDETRAGFFKAEKLTAELTLVNTDGNEFTLQRVFPDIKERYFYKIKYSLNDEGENEEAGADFDGIIVDEKADTISYGIFIKEEDLFGKSAPRLTLDGFTENKLVYKKTDDPAVPEHSLAIEAPNGIKQLKVEAASFQFADIPSFDLCNLTDAERAQLQGLGFPIEEVKDKTEVTFKLAGFAKALAPASETQMGTHTFTFSVLDNLHQEATVSFTYEVRPNVNVTTEEPVVWAKFVTLRGNSADKDNIGFMLKKKTDVDYQKYETTAYDEQTGNFSLLLTEGIEPNTEYQYYAVSGTDDTGDVKTFTTDDTPTIPNLSFDNWCKDGSVVYPNIDLSGSNHFWDSGNKGANSADKTPTESTGEAVRGNAAYMHSEWAIVTFAAGNIYTGQFVKAIVDLSNPGAEIDFGQPYTGRPTKLTGYYKYIPKSVNRGGHGELTMGKMDKCSIYIALCKWSSRFRVNTQTGTFVDLNSSDIIAYGELSDAEASRTDMTEYEKFEIDIKYRNLTTEPTYILIVASASKYGDYFTGGEGSSLYIDEFELGFDYNAASFTNE